MKIGLEDGPEISTQFVVLVLPSPQPRDLSYLTNCHLLFVQFGDHLV